MIARRTLHLNARIVFALVRELQRRGESLAMKNAGHYPRTALEQVESLRDALSLLVDDEPGEWTLLLEVDTQPERRSRDVPGQIVAWAE